MIIQVYDRKSNIYNNHRYNIIIMVMVMVIVMVLIIIPHVD